MLTVTVCSLWPERCLPKLTSLQLCGCCYSTDSALTPEVVDAWLALQPALQWLEVDAVPRGMAAPVLQQLPKLLGLTQLALTDCDSFEVSPVQLGAVLAQLSGLQELWLCRWVAAGAYDVVLRESSRFCLRSLALCWGS